MTMVDTAVVALAGRRIDLPEALVPRFPLKNVQSWATRLRSSLRDAMLSHLFVWAACGAELVALVCGDASCCLSRLNDSGRPRLLTVPATGVRCMISRSPPRPRQAIFSCSTLLPAATPPTRSQTRQLFTKRKRLRAQPGSAHGLIAILVWKEHHVRAATRPPDFEI